MIILAFLFLHSFLSMTQAQQSQQSLVNDALHEILQRGRPILGDDTGCSNARTCDWMANFPDDTLLVNMNLPGTHDAATWNYTNATREALIRYTGPDVPPADIHRCQQKSLFSQLNDGIRVFDLRVAYNPGNDTIGFYHANSLLAPTTQLQDVLFGFYTWLDEHPTETALISINHESGTNTPYDLKFEKLLYDTLHNAPAKRFWSQKSGEVGTLGEARGKLVLLQRWDYMFLPASNTDLGIYLSAARWTPNGPDIDLVYNDNPVKHALIEDMFEPLVPPNSGVEINVESKFNATTAHVSNAISNATKSGDSDPDTLFISFASAEKTADAVPITPVIMALGVNGTDGMNQRLLSWLQGVEGGRKGIIMLDFYDEPEGLVEAVIGL